MKKLAVIGDQPNPNGNLDVPVWTEGRSAERLAAWFGLPIKKFAEIIEGSNVSEIDEAQRLMARYRCIVLVGNVAIEKMLTDSELELMAPPPSLVLRESSVVLCLPHPSGRNRKLNDFFYRSRVNNICRFYRRKYLPEVFPD